MLLGRSGEGEGGTLSAGNTSTTMARKQPITLHASLPTYFDGGGVYYTQEASTSRGGGGTFGFSEVRINFLGGGLKRKIGLGWGPFVRVQSLLSALCPFYSKFYLL